MQTAFHYLFGCFNHEQVCAVAGVFIEDDIMHYTQDSSVGEDNGEAV